MKGVLKRMGPEGHTEIEWDTDKPATVMEVREEFERIMIANGMTHRAFAVTSPPGAPKEAEPITPRQFDPEIHREVVITTAMQGG